MVGLIDSFLSSFQMHVLKKRRERKGEGGMHNLILFMLGEREEKRGWLSILKNRKEKKRDFPFPFSLQAISILSVSIFHPLPVCLPREREREGRRRGSACLCIYLAVGGQ
mmetsp:Transcript_12017/g.23132  ORF Transcript_12017/g.23132 Transcript_12017/m.23132 type:complete len:110 (-) Transcript_12017:1004-1333(-)